MAEQVGVVRLDLEGPYLPAPTGAALATLVVVRADGVPIGSSWFAGAAPASRAAILARAVRRADGPPGPAPRSIAVTVAVCTRDRPGRLARCLRSVRSAAGVAGAEAELDLLVVDNASTTDRTREVASSAGARWVREPVRGLDIARNRAVTECRGELLAFVDDDVVVDPTWLRTMVRAFARHPHRSAVSGQVLAYTLDTPARVEFERMGGFSLGWDARLFETGEDRDLPLRSDIGGGCNMAFRRAAFEEVGLFDEALDTGRPLPAGGDLDMMMRMAAAGGVVYEPSAVVFHEHRRTWSELRYQYYTWGKGWSVVLAKWYRSDPRLRAPIRRVAVDMLRSYAKHFVYRSTRPDTYRRSHSVLMAAGFLVGWAGCYPRSVRRMRRRRSAVAASGRGGGTAERAARQRAMTSHG